MIDKETLRINAEFHDKLIALMNPYLDNIDKNYDAVMVALISSLAATLIEKNPDDYDKLLGQLKRTLQSLTDVTHILFDTMQQDNDKMGPAHPTVQ